jgi:hypothetical protein
MARLNGESQRRIVRGFRSARVCSAQSEREGFSSSSTSAPWFVFARLIEPCPLVNYESTVVPGNDVLWGGKNLGEGTISPTYLRPR